MAEAEPRVHRLCTCAQPECLERVHTLLSALWADVPDMADTERYAFETAVAEIAANIVQHSRGPRDVDINLELLAHADRVEACFHDTGIFADVDVDSAKLPDDMAEHGRGLAIARAAVDEVAYERDGDSNRWRLVKRRTP